MKKLMFLAMLLLLHWGITSYAMDEGAQSSAADSSTERHPFLHPDYFESAEKPASPVTKEYRVSVSESIKRKLTAFSLSAATTAVQCQRYFSTPSGLAVPFEGD
jgi:hypothetical protein